MRPLDGPSTKTLATPQWREFGRSRSQEPPDWITWVATVGHQGDALYRTMTRADGLLSVAIELGPRLGSGPQSLCREQCSLPGAREQIAGRIRQLLAIADEKAVRALEAIARTRKGSDHLRPVPPSSKGHLAPEHRVRERAYYLWEREGRPEGRALEFWVRARREEEAQAA
jgi:Protein of unknown function (DUF2934)